MNIILDDLEIRILGSLIEKQLATPEYYPLSLNALANACNQKTNREPVTAYTEDSLEAALERLMEKQLTNRSMVGRVPKYEELFTRQHNLVPKEAALLCVLLLRGPQTMGELRGRTSRMASFDSLEVVMETMAHLVDWGMVHQLPRLPGHKESRYGHLFGATPTEAPAEQSDAQLDQQSTPPTDDGGRLDAMQKEIEALHQALSDLKQEFEAFKQLFG